MTKFDTQINKLLVESDKEEPVMTLSRYSSKMWRLKNGKLHREDGPAVESPNGYKEWYINGEHHRIGGPAIENPDGTKIWYINGKLHREDGPAIINHGNNTKEWWVNGQQFPSLDHWRGWESTKKNVSPEHQQSVLDILDL